MAVDRIGRQGARGHQLPVDTFVQLIEDTPRVVQSVPLLGFAQAGAGGYFDDGGFPAGKGWDEVGLPSVNDEHAYALKISGDSMKPAYRDGDVIVVSPGRRSHGRPRGGENQGRRGHGQGTEAPHRQDPRTAVAQSQPRRPHARGLRRGLDRADRVGEPVDYAGRCANAEIHSAFIRASVIAARECRRVNEWVRLTPLERRREGGGAPKDAPCVSVGPQHEFPTSETRGHGNVFRRSNRGDFWLRDRASGNRLGFAKPPDRLSPAIVRSSSSH